jgi:molybdopterin-guanine dinucleotide biosynthesis protein A
MAASLPAGGILAGGRSSRMGGRHKALLEVRGKPLLQHVIDRLQPQVSSLSLSVERAGAPLAMFGLPQVADARPGFRGPLGGLLALLEALPADAEHLLLVPCDAPLLPLDLGRRLAERLAAGGLPACLVRYDGELQPTFSLWHRRLLPELRGAVLDEGLSGFKQFLGRVCLSVLDWQPAAVSPFFNVNTPAELEQLRGLLHSGQGAST